MTTYHNPLGLLYTLYGDPDLRIKEASNANHNQ
jgi:hypothetical protein